MRVQVINGWVSSLGGSRSTFLGVDLGEDVKTVVMVGKLKHGVEYVGLTSFAVSGRFTGLGLSESQEAVFLDYLGVPLW